MHSSVKEERKEMLVVACCGALGHPVVALHSPAEALVWGDNDPDHDLRLSAAVTRDQPARWSLVPVQIVSSSRSSSFTPRDANSLISVNVVRYIPKK